MYLSDIARYCGGVLKGSDARIDAVSTDTRSIAPGVLFVALCGARFDGHTFVPEAIAQGASAIVTNRAFRDISSVVVEDTSHALGKIAALHRSLQKDLRVLAITGSCGKTSCKNAMWSICQSQAPTLKTAKNENNHIGVPLTLLGLKETHRFGIVELGTDHPGEIAYTAAITQPDVALITQISPAHLENFPSFRDYAQEKFAIAKDLSSSQTLVHPSDMPFKEKCITKAQTLSFGRKEGDIRLVEAMSESEGTKVELITPLGSMHIQSNLIGAGAVDNILACTAAACALRLEKSAIEQGLASVVMEPGRMEKMVLKSGAVLLNDSYNASFASVLQSLDYCDQYNAKAKKVIVLGAMAQLGDESIAYHQQVAKRLVDVCPDRCLFMGPEDYFDAMRTIYPALEYHQNHQSMAKVLKTMLNPDHFILLKGARRYQLEQLINLL